MKLADDPTLYRSSLPTAPEEVATVTLVGAGPGDPELLTVKAANALRAARVVLYDHLVGKEVLELVPKSASLIYVGKESSNHTLEQPTIIELMVRLAKSGRPVLRLKGGDGYIFGRGGEEAEALARKGIPFKVIPGLSAAQAAAANSGIPLTHREHAATLVFATGHGREDSAPDLDWTALARPRQTVVVYMGVGTLPIISRRLIEHGLAPDIAAAIVERASMPGERCIVGTLATLAALAREHGVKPPALLIIGSVVSLQPLLVAGGVGRGPR